MIYLFKMVIYLFIDDLPIFTSENSWITYIYLYLPQKIVELPIFTYIYLRK